MTSWNAKDIYCPKCGAAPGADCRDLAQGNSTNNGPHWYRHAAARAIARIKNSDTWQQGEANQ